VNFPLKFLDYLKHPFLIIDEGGDAVFACSKVREWLDNGHNLDNILAYNHHWERNVGKYKLIEFDDLSFPQRLIAENADTLFDLLDDGLQIVDKNGVSLFYNRADSEYEGLSKEEVIGHSIMELYPDIRKNQYVLLKVLNTGRPIIRKEYVYASIKRDRIESLTSTIPLNFNGKLLAAAEIVHNTKNIRVLSDNILDLHNRLGMQKKGEKASGAYYTFKDIIGNNKKFREIINDAQIVAQKNYPVLLYGETGTGKELFAQSIHNASNYANGPFVALNCAAIPSNLMEGMLFGTVKGAYTGAENRVGLLEHAAGGTMFLDEVQSLDQELQAKLLRVLQEGTFRRVGDYIERPVQARIISAMNIMPEEAIEKRKIRADLYYRLCFFRINIPPLRERKDDISLFIQYFLDEYRRTSGCKVEGISPETMSYLYSYSWPGNVRQLEHMIISNAALTGTGESIEIDPMTFKSKQHDALSKVNIKQDLSFPKNKSLPETLRDIEQALIEKSLQNNNHSITKAAQALGISRQSLQYRISRFKK